MSKRLLFRLLARYTVIFLNNLGVVARNWGYLPSQGRLEVGQRKGLEDHPVHPAVGEQLHVGRNAVAGDAEDATGVAQETDGAGGRGTVHDGLGVEKNRRESQQQRRIETIRLEERYSNATVRELTQTTGIDAQPQPHSPSQSPSRWRHTEAAAMPCVA